MIKVKGIHNSAGLVEHTWDCSSSQPLPEVHSVLSVIATGPELQKISANSIQSIPIVRGERCKWEGQFALFVWSNIYELLELDRPDPTPKFEAEPEISEPTH